MAIAGSETLPVGKAPRVRRVLLDLGQVEVAEAAGVSVPLVSMAETGRGRLSPAALERARKQIAKTLTRLEQERQMAAEPERVAAGAA